MALKQPGLGAEGDVAGGVAAGQRLGQCHDFGVLGDLQSGKAGQRLPGKAAVRGQRAHRRCQLPLRVVLHLAQHGLGIVGRQGAEFEIEAAGRRHDVERGAARDEAAVDRAVGHVVVVVEGSLGGLAPGHVGQARDDPGGGLYGIDAARRERGVALQAAHPAALGQLALVGADDLHLGRLADDAGARLDRLSGQLLEQPGHAHAADLLIIGQAVVDRRRQATLQKLRGVGQGDPDETLHVAGAAAVEPAVALAWAPGIARPVLAVDRHHVAVAGQRDAASVRGPEGGVEVRLAPLVVVAELAGGAQILQIVPHVVDQLEVGVAAGRVEADQSFDHGAAGGLRSAWLVHEDS